jgi:hypothetical protein
MSEERLTEAEFREATNHAIRAVLNIYTEVRDLFGELASALGTAEPALGPITRALQPKARKAHYQDRILPRWSGYIYRLDEGEDTPVEDEDDDDGDSETGGVKGRRVIIPWGGSMAFARAILYQPGRLDWEPVIQYGVVTGARVAVRDYPQEQGLNLRVPALRVVLYEIPEEQGGIERKEIVCRRLRIPPVKGITSSTKDRELRLSVPCKPKTRPLYSLDSTEKVAHLADEIRQIWEQHGD